MKTHLLCLALTASGAALAQPVPPVPATAPALPAPVAAPVAPLAPLPPVPPGWVGKLYTPGAFDRIELDGASHVVIFQGDRDQVFVEGGDEAQRQVSVEVRDGRLMFRQTSGWRFWSPSRMNLRIDVRNLRQISVSGATDLHAPGPIQVDVLKLSISGAGNARFDRLQARELAFDISGAGDGQLAGQVGEFALRISGKGKVVADQLKAERAQVRISGIGNAALWVTGELSANISGVGSVDYYGQPQVQRSVSGLGSINAKGERR
jgi:hypothetical protein